MAALWPGPSLHAAAPKSAAGTEPNFPVTQFVFVYQHPEDALGPDISLPDPADFEQLTVQLKQLDGYYSASESSPAAFSPIALARKDTVRNFTPSALSAINAAVVAELNRRGIFGVMAKVDPMQIDFEKPYLIDSRRNKKELRILVYYGRLSQVRIEHADAPSAAWLRSPSAVGDRILSHLPLHSGGLLRKNVLGDYLDGTNRFPGRRIEAIIAPGQKTGTIDLTLRLSEGKRFSAFSIVSNDGTKFSGEWRKRLSLEARQFAGVDDLLSFQYLTSNFTEYQSFNVSEEFGLVFPDVCRGKISASYSELSLSDFGANLSNYDFTSKSLGLETTWKPAVWAGWPVSITGGAQAYEAATLNGATQTEVSSTFLVPYLAMETQNQSPKGEIRGSLRFEYISTEDSREDILDRTEISTDAWLSRWSLLLSRRAGSLRELVAPTPSQVGPVYELSLNLRGQRSMSDSKRLAPLFVGVAGGVDTVRGHQESIASGDTVSLATLESRVSFTNIFRPSHSSEANPSFENAAHKVPTREQPMEVSFRTFIDGARVHTNRADATIGEVSDRSLLGAGIGLDLVARGPLNGLVRTDLGFALKEQKQPGTNEVRAGSSRVHLSVMLLW
jgi:hemolysin activation/secretion protein